MRTYAWTLAAVIAAAPVAAEEFARGIELLPGHPIYREAQGEAGVVMALSIAAGQIRAADLTQACEELRAAAGLPHERDDGLRLETVFIVPYKAMAIEGYYFPKDDTVDSGKLVRGDATARATLDRIVAQAGIPSALLDETDVEHEISCQTGEPGWFIRWEDIRTIAGEQPDTVIERAYHRFMAVHRSVIEQAVGKAEASSPVHRSAASPRKALGETLSHNRRG